MCNSKHRVSVKSSFQAFMKGIIDYAALFPPARRPLEEAIRQYADHRRGEDAWMLSRFLIPVDWLDIFKHYGKDFIDVEKSIEFAVLGKKTDTIDEFEAEIEHVANQCEQFRDYYGGGVTTEILEISLPGEVVFSGNKQLLLTELLNRTINKLNRSARTPARVFLDPNLSENWKRDLPVIMEAIARHNETEAKKAEHYRYTGIKFHFGGAGNAAIPSSEQVAFSLNRAREYNIAVKLAAGLLRPLRCYDETTQTRVHGFLNIIGGALLGYAHDLTDDELAHILEEEDPEYFLFTDEALCWKDYAVFTGEIAELREVALLSYESSSFDAPAEALRKLQFLV